MSFSNSSLAKVGSLKDLMVYIFNCLSHRWLTGIFLDDEVPSRLLNQLAKKRTRCYILFVWHRVF